MFFLRFCPFSGVDALLRCLGDCHVERSEAMNECLGQNQELHGGGNCSPAFPQLLYVVLPSIGHRLMFRISEGRVPLSSLFGKMTDAD